jgi:hypothetical protein
LKALERNLSPGPLLGAFLCAERRERRSGMTGTVTLASLPPARERLVKLMQEVNFGRIEELAIRDKEPVFDPPPRIVREVKFCAENGPRPETTRQDFVLKAQVVDLFAQIETLGNGVIISLEVKHGLPFKMTIREDAAKHGNRLSIGE